MSCLISHSFTSVISFCCYILQRIVLFIMDQRNNIFLLSFFLSVSSWKICHILHSPFFFMLGRWVEDHEVVHNIMFNTTTNEKIFYKKALTRSEWWDNGVLPLWITAQNQVNNYSVFSGICKLDTCDNRWNGVNIFFPKLLEQWQILLMTPSY